MEDEDGSDVGRWARGQMEMRARTTWPMDGQIEDAMAYDAGELIVDGPKWQGGCEPILYCSPVF